MHRSSRLALFLTVLGLALPTAPASAEEPLVGSAPTLDPRAVGVSGALRASASGISGLYLNPATIALVPLYHIGFMYGYTGRDQQHMGGVAIVDSVTTVVAAGLAFNYTGIDQPRTSHLAYDGRLALAGMLGDMFALGGCLRYLRVEQNLSASRHGPAGPPALPGSGSVQLNGITLDLGAALTLAKVLTLGVTGQNLTNTGSVFAPVTLGGGVSLSLFDMWLLEVDTNVDFTSYDKTGVDIQAGTEVFLAGQLGLRVGYGYDMYYAIHQLSGGVGYAHPSFGLDIGFSSEVQEDPRWQLLAGLKIFIN